MARTTKIESRPPRVLTSDEIKLMEELKEALIGKVLADRAIKACRQTIGRLTPEINKLDFSRGHAVWAEATKLAKEKTK